LEGRENRQERGESSFRVRVVRVWMKDVIKVRGDTFLWGRECQWDFEYIFDLFDASVIY